MKAYILILIIIFVLCSCNRDKTDEEFVPGELNVSFKEKSSLGEIFNLINTLELDIKRIVGHQYVSDLPNDSFDYVIAVLNTKQYLNDERWQVVKDGNVSIHFNTGKIIVNCSLLNMTRNNQDDWFNTVNQISLIEQPFRKTFYLNVPIGKEILYRELFRKLNIVEWAEIHSTEEGTFFD